MARIMVLVPDPNWKEIISIRLASVQYRLNYVGALRCVVAGISEIHSKCGRWLGHQVCQGPKAICLLISSQEPRGQSKSQVQGLGFQFDFESQQIRKLLAAGKPPQAGPLDLLFQANKSKTLTIAFSRLPLGVKLRPAGGRAHRIDLLKRERRA